MSGPPSGGRVRHLSPVRQAEQLLPVTVSRTPAVRDGGAPAAGGATPDPPWGRRGREGGGAAAFPHQRPGRPCAAAALLCAATILALG
jgi:hypothetical protein